MGKLFLVSVVFVVSGCGTFSIKNIERSDSSLEFAKRIFSKIDYSKLNDRFKLPNSSVKSIGPVQLYSAQTVPLFIDQNAWNYVQRVKRNDGIECYSYIQIRLTSSNEFEISPNIPGKFYCLESDDKYQSLELL